MRLSVLACAACASAFRGFTPHRRVVRLPPRAALATPERGALGATGLAWVGVGARCFDAEAARSAVGAFGVATGTVEELIREPAAGFLELTSPLFALEGALLLALALDAFADEPEDAARVGASLALASGGALGCLALALAAGTPIDDGAVAPLVDLFFITAAVSLKAVGAAGVDDVPGLIQRDIVELATGGGDGVEADGVYRTLESFYRGSVLVGLLVGASFIFSPVNPIGVFETESPATHFFRAACGLSIALVLCPVENILWRKTRAGELGRTSARVLNAFAGVAAGLLVVDGGNQVDAGSRAFAELVRTAPDSEIVRAINGGDVGRAVTNTNAAYSVGLVVALFYAYQAAFPLEPEG